MGTKAGGKKKATSLVQVHNTIQGSANTTEDVNEIIKVPKTVHEGYSFPKRADAAAQTYSPGNGILVIVYLQAHLRPMPN